MLFPKRCPICDKVLGLSGEKICPSCRKKLIYIQSPFCKKCGKQIEDDTKEYCRDCETNPHEYDEGRAVFLYPCIRRSIYRLKYKNRKEYAKFYGEEMVKVLDDTLARWDVQAIVPVPLHKTRLKKRGYNQAELLAKELGKITNIPVVTGLVVRDKNTTPQKSLNAVERQNNLENAFKLVANDVKLTSIVIIDDIYTTGSTIDAMARAMKLAGIKKVFYIAVAIGRQ